MTRKIHINSFNLLTGPYTGPYGSITFDFSGSSSDVRRTPQGFLRVSARLTKTGIFHYDNGREYRSDDEVFKADSLDLIKGASVSGSHPSEKGTTPS